MHTLILFDIDGTLFRGDGAGSAAFRLAGHEMFGDRFANTDLNFSGRLDPWIMGSLLSQNEIEVDDATARDFRARCHEHLKTSLTNGRHDVQAMRGGHDLVHRLRELEHVTLGLLTGNWAENGRLKVGHVGYDPDHFEINVWGDDGKTRDDLPPVGLRRYADAFGRDIPPSSVVIIGDTEHDIHCAKVNECRSIGVATGMYDLNALRESGADLAVSDLADTESLLDWILNPVSR